MSGFEPILMGALVGSTVMQAAGSVQAGKEQASMLQRQADVRSQTSRMESDRIRREGVQARGTTAAMYGAAGLELSGSPLDVLEQSALWAELDAQTALWGGQADATTMQHQARLARRAGWTQAASQVLTTAPMIASMGSFGGVENMGGVKTGQTPVPGTKPIVG